METYKKINQKPLPLRLLAFLLALGLALSLSACQGLGGKETPKDGTTATESVQTDESEQAVTNNPGSGTLGENETNSPEIQKLQMPVLRVTTNGGAGVNSKEEYTACSVSMENGFMPISYAFSDAVAGIRLRGNSTAGTEKKPYRLKFEEKRNLLGLNKGAKCKSWVLMADYFDASLQRNALTFALGQTLTAGTSAFCSDCTWVELYINDAYQGVYLLCEQTQINSNRVDIAEKEEGQTDLNIGYLLVGQGGRTDEPNTVRVPISAQLTDRNGLSMKAGNQIFSLSGGDYTQEQIEYIENWVAAVYQIAYQAIYNNNYYTLRASDCTLHKKTAFIGKTAEEKQQETIAAVIDLPAAVRMYMLDEIIKDLDSGTFNLCVDLSPTGSRKLTFTAPWDFDFALGNTKYQTTLSTTGLYAANFSYSDGYRTNSWYILLNSADWFRDAVREAWREVYPALLTDAENVTIAALQFEDAFVRNYQRWETLGQYLQGHQSNAVYGYSSEKDAADDLYRWISSRLRWLNSLWGEDGVENPDAVMDMSVADYSSFFEGYHNAEGFYDKNEGSMVFTVTDSRDPYVYLYYEKNGISLDAGSYPYLEITYRMPTTNAQSDYRSEIFLVSGSVEQAQGGISVTFPSQADGEWHTVRLALGTTGFWSGKIHALRLDFVGTCAVGDTFEVKKIELKSE